MPTKPLSIPKYFAALRPTDVLKNTTKGIPCLCDGFPIKLEKKQISIDAIKVPAKTTVILML